MSDTRTNDHWIIETAILTARRRNLCQFEADQSREALARMVTRIATLEAQNAAKPMDATTAATVFMAEVNRLTSPEDHPERESLIRAQAATIIHLRLQNAAHEAAAEARAKRIVDLESALTRIQTVAKRLAAEL